MERLIAAELGQPLTLQSPFTPDSPTHHSGARLVTQHCGRRLERPGGPRGPSIAEPVAVSKDGRRRAAGWAERSRGGADSRRPEPTWRVAIADPLRRRRDPQPGAAAVARPLAAAQSHNLNSALPSPQQATSSGTGPAFSETDLRELQLAEQAIERELQGLPDTLVRNPTQPYSQSASNGSPRTVAPVSTAQPVPLPTQSANAGFPAQPPVPTRSSYARLQQEASFGFEVDADAQEATGRGAPMQAAMPAGLSASTASLQQLRDSMRQQQGQQQQPQPSTSYASYNAGAGPCARLRAGGFVGYVQSHHNTFARCHRCIRRVVSSTLQLASVHRSCGGLASALPSQPRLSLSARVRDAQRANQR